MPSKKLLSFTSALVLLCAAGCHSKSNSPAAAREAASPASVDTSRLVHADNEPGNWMTYGRTYSEQRFSPLKQINDQNVGQLALAWYVDLDSHRGDEATPIVVDGVMYFTTTWSRVFAVKASTGEKLWSYDPKVPPEWAINACCDVVNRGVAVWRGRVFVATLDGRLVALDAATGKPAWETLTVDRSYRYSITGAPRVVKGKVLIGNGGAEYGVRGYISAYDADTGKMVWRFYTVPGDPSQAYESPILEKAAKTWKGQRGKLGGGGTVWDSIAYDPDLDLVYFGVGNGTPWDRPDRSPRGGDNLFICSIVALKADTGEYVWHYQETPGDAWDYDSAESIILADLTINNSSRKVLLHAPKNGFLLRAGPRHGRIAFRQALHCGLLGQLHRLENQPPRREPRRHLRKSKIRFASRPRTVRRPHLALHVLQPAHRPGLHPCLGLRLPLQIRAASPSK